MATRVVPLSIVKKYWQLNTVNQMRFYCIFFQGKL